jgi:hypothetical protein
MLKYVKRKLLLFLFNLPYSRFTLSEYCILQETMRRLIGNRPLYETGIYRL